MQFTPQQMAGYKGYSSGVLIGNWSEDIQVQEDKLHTFQAQKKGADVDPVVVLNDKVCLAPAKADGYVRFGAPLQIRSLVHDGVDDQALAIDTNAKRRPKPNQALVSLSTSPFPLARAVWTLRKTRDLNAGMYARQSAPDVLHYGQLCRIVNEVASLDGFYSLTSEKVSATAQSRGGKQMLSACLGTSNDCNFVVEPADATNGADGQPVPIGARIVIRHAMTRIPVFADEQSKLLTVGGAEIEAAAHLSKRQATKGAEPQTPGSYWTIAMAAQGSTYRPPKYVPTPQSALERVRNRILQRAGGSGFRGIVRSLRLMDDDGSRTLNRLEFKDGMATYGVPLETSEVDFVFAVFDRNGDGVITITEFLRTLRGPISTRRLKLVKDAFACVDRDGSGVVVFAELKAAYGRGLSKHPDIIAGTKTPQQVLQEFVKDWDRNGDGRVTLEEFVEYYSDLSCNIDDDDYFELMLRNAWHMSGGEGWAENTSNKRVLVVHSDGSSEVVELTNDLGVDVKDVNAIRAKLEEQGVMDIKRIELHH